MSPTSLCSGLKILEGLCEGSLGVGQGAMAYTRQHMEDCPKVLFLSRLDESVSSCPVLFTTGRALNEDYTAAAPQFEAPCPNVQSWAIRFHYSFFGRRRGRRVEDLRV